MKIIDFEKKKIEVVNKIAAGIIYRNTAGKIWERDHAIMQ